MNEPLTSEEKRLWLMRNSAMVRNMVQGGFQWPEMVYELVKQKEALIQEVIALDSIAPRKTIAPDGTTLVWRCPDELIPIR